MAIVTEYDWETNSYHNHMPAIDGDDSMAAHQRWLDAVHQATARAHQAMPTHRERIERALTLVLEGHVEPHEGGVFQVRSQSKASSKAYTVNGFCECPDARRLSDGACKHLLATFLYRRAKKLVQEQASDTATPTPAPSLAEPAPALEASTVPQGIPHQHIAVIQGKAFVKYAGLLQMAQERGLQELKAEWTHNDTELSLAHAVATFQDGRRFEESGDASPSNCNRMVKAHFRRVALTRAKARVLRDALGIDLVAVEELADSD